MGVGRQGDEVRQDDEVVFQDDIDDHEGVVVVRQGDVQVVVHYHSNRVDKLLRCPTAEACQRAKSVLKLMHHPPH